MQADLDSALSAFLGDLKAAMAVRALGHAAQRAAHRRIFGGVDGNPPAANEPQPARQTACRYLDACYQAVESAEPEIRRLVASFRALEPRLAWANEGERRISAALAEAYADALVVGPGGLATSDVVEIGVSVMAPGTLYPDHRHPPEELYIALSTGHWRQEDGPWIEPGVGGLIHNPANIVHAMRAGEKPLLAIWCLPLA